MPIAENADLVERLHQAMERIYLSIDSTHVLEHYPLNIVTRGSGQGIDLRIQEQLKKLGYM